MAVLLAFDHPVVAGQEAAVAERAVLFRVQRLDGAGDSQDDRAGLAVDSAAGGLNPDVDLAVHSGRLERRFDQQAMPLNGEIVFEFAAVDGDLAVSLADADASHGRLAAAGADGRAVGFDAA